MANSTRTFAAIEVPAKLRERLTRLQRTLEPDAPGVRWVDPAQFHITLAFLGDVAAADLSGVCRAVAEAVVGFAPFDLHLEGVGAFPSPSKARVLWMGAEGPGAEAIVPLQAAVAEALNRAGYPPDERFHPHVTLGRRKPGRGPELDARPLIARHRQWSPGTFAVDQVVTFASELTPDGPVYAPLAVAPLRGRKTGATP